MTQATKTISAPALATIDTATLAAILRSGAKVVLLDARPGEHTKRIPGAKVLGVKSTASEVEEAVGPKDQLIITYCSDPHCSESMVLYRRLRALGYMNVLDYLHGVEGWATAGYPVEEG